MSTRTDNALISCPKCGRPGTTTEWIRLNGQCGACGARQEAKRIRDLDVSPNAVAARLHKRDDRRAPWASETEHDREIRALLAELGVTP